MLPMLLPPWAALRSARGALWGISPSRRLRRPRRRPRPTGHRGRAAGSAGISARARAGGEDACRVNGPGLGRMGGDAGDGQPVGAVLAERRRVEPAARRGVAGREGAGGDPFGLGGEDLAPGRAKAARGRANVRGVEDSPDRPGGDGAVAPGRLALDPPVPPAGVLPRQTRNELFDRLPGRRPSGSRAPPAVVSLGGAAPAVPGQERAGGDREDRAPKAAGLSARRAAHQNRCAGA
ncbi:hypothetical protein ACVW19_006345 [Streptomyces sp. TE5632]